MPAMSTLIPLLRRYGAPAVAAALAISALGMAASSAAAAPEQEAAARASETPSVHDLDWFDAGRGRAVPVRQPRRVREEVPRAEQ